MLAMASIARRRQPPDAHSQLEPVARPPVRPTAGRFDQGVHMHNTASPSAAAPPREGPPRFGFPHACVIIAFLETAVLLAALKMPVPQVLWLIGGAGSIGSGVVVLTVAGGTRRISSALRALLGPER
ncbi:hypothetical protein ACFQ8M_29955 [Bacillus cereus]|uniref:hypothetical protein n=2 Tax=Bacillati TaxID=1783272 RepID=UPI00366C75F1